MDYGVDRRGVWVRGPWEAVAPGADIDQVVDQLCPAVMQLPDARGHDDGVEYCGLIYVGTDGKLYASAPSPVPPDMAKVRSSRNKACRIPRTVNDVAGVSSVEADFHSHPWPDSPLTSIGDTQSSAQRYSFRIQFDTICHVLKFVPHLNEAVPGEVFERTGRSWRLLRVIPVWDKERGKIDPPFEVP